MCALHDASSLCVSFKNCKKAWVDVQGIYGGGGEKRGIRREASGEEVESFIEEPNNKNRQKNEK